MRRGLAGQNVSQRAPHVVLECVVLCVVVYDTSDTFLLSVQEYLNLWQIHFQETNSDFLTKSKTI